MSDEGVDDPGPERRAARERARRRDADEAREARLDQGSRERMEARDAADRGQGVDPNERDGILRREREQRLGVEPEPGAWTRTDLDGASVFLGEHAVDRLDARTEEREADAVPPSDVGREYPSIPVHEGSQPIDDPFDEPMQSAQSARLPGGVGEITKVGMGFGALVVGGLIIGFVAFGDDDDGDDLGASATTNPPVQAASTPPTSGGGSSRPRPPVISTTIGARTECLTRPSGPVEFVFTPQSSGAFGGKPITVRASGTGIADRVETFTLGTAPWTVTVSASGNGTWRAVVETLAGRPWSEVSAVPSPQADHTMRCQS